MMIKFLRDKSWAIIYTVLMTFVFSVLFLLMDVDMHLIVYGCILCAAFSFVYLVALFIRYRRRYQQTMIFLCQTDADVKLLPQYKDSTEKLLSELLKEQVRIRKKIQSKSEQKYSDMMDYYTIWAHQIKTPIAAMSLQLQQDEALDAQKLKMELMRIEQYSDMVLQYLRLDSPFSDYEFSSYPIDSMIKECIRKWANVI